MNLPEGGMKIADKEINEATMLNTAVYCHFRLVCKIKKSPEKIFKDESSTKLQSFFAYQ